MFEKYYVLLLNFYNRQRTLKMKIAKNVEHLLSKFENLVEKWADILF